MSVPANQMAPAPAEVWSTGDYADVCDRMIPELGARLVELAGLRPGERVLDVATGTGNAALPAAHAGGRVTALDITPVLLQVGAQRAAEGGVEITWVHGDAEALPFADASFDRVLSCVGVQFCSDRHAAASELVRVCRPGGRLALIAWTPDGFIGQVLTAIAQATGAAGARPPALEWGRETGINDLFADQVTGVNFRPDHVEMPASSPASWVDYMAGAYGPMVRARAGLETRGAWEPVRGRLIEIATAHDSCGNDAFVGRSEYLGTVIDR